MVDRYVCGRLVQQGPGDGESEECSEHSIIQDIFPPKVRLLESLYSVGPSIMIHDYLSVQMWEEEGVLWRQSVLTRVPVRGDVVSGHKVN